MSKGILIVDDGEFIDLLRYRLRDWVIARTTVNKLRLLLAPSLQSAACSKSKVPVGPLWWSLRTRIIVLK